MNGGGEPTPAPGDDPLSTAPPSGPVPPARRPRCTGYAHPLAFYPTQFQQLLLLAAPPVRERALKWWIAAGRDATPPELPPLDDPPRLRDWWIRIKPNYRPPDWLVALAALPSSVANSTPPPLAPPPSPLASPSADPAIGPLFAAVSTPPARPSLPAPSSVAPPPTSSSAPGAGYAAALQRVRDAEAAAGELYTSLLRQAAAPGCTAEERARLGAEAEHARRAWDELVNRLRPMEKDAAEILREAGLVWDIADVLGSATTVHVALRDSFLSLWRRVRVRMRACASADEEDELWRIEVDKLFATLRANQFTRPADVAEPPA